MNRILKITFIVLVMLHLGVIGYGLTTSVMGVFTPRDIPEQFRAFQIAEGASLSDVLENLHQKQLAPPPLYMRLALIRKASPLVVKKGSYTLPERASAWDILQIFEEGRVRLHRITIPEGLDKWQTARLLGSEQWGSEEAFLQRLNDPAGILDLDPDAKDLEGYLFPETYFFPEEATPEEIVDAILKQFRQQTKPLRGLLRERGLSLREWVTLASLIEEETSNSEERATISSVFDNRLKRGMLLQCDPTIIYSLKLANQYKGRIYKSQIKFDSPYNTYVYKGLPPGPIASPGFPVYRRPGIPPPPPICILWPKTMVLTISVNL